MLTAKAPTAALRKYVWSQGLLKVIDTTALVLFLLAVASTGGGGGQDYWPATLPSDEPKSTHVTPNQQAVCKPQSPSKRSGLSFPG